MTTKTLIRLAAALAATLAMGASAHAAATYCKPNATNAAGMKLSDVTFSGNSPSTSADDCYGLVVGQDVAPGADKADNINDLALTWGSDWQYLAKDDVNGGANLGTFNNIQYTLNTGPAGTSGNWTLTAVALAPATLPVFVDFIVSLKGSNEYALWLFDDVKIDGSDGGSWTSVFTNRNGNLQALSHLTLFVREGDDPNDPPVLIPEPAGITLVGLALAAAGFASRRRRQA